MSFWLKRVESFLEQVDSTAATQIGTLKNDDTTAANRESNTSYNDPYVSSKPTNGTVPSIKSKSSNTASAAPPKPRDDDIFKFLNDNDATPPPASSVQRLAMPVPKTKKEKAKKSVAPASTQAPRARAPTPTQVAVPASAQPPKPKTPPSPPSVSPSITPSILPSQPSPSITPSQPSPVISPQPPSPTREPAKEKEEPEAELKFESEPPSATPEPSEQPADSAEGGEKGGWEDGDVIIGEEGGRKSPVRSSSPRTQDHVDDEGQRKEVEGDKSENNEQNESNNVLIHTDTSESLDEQTTKQVDNEGDVKQADEKMGGEVEAETTRADVSEESETIEERREEEMKEQEEAKKEEKEEKEEKEDEEEDEEEGQEDVLNAEFVQKFNDLVTQNEKVERENKLMRQEVVKLHEEIRSLTNKNRSVSEAMEQMTEVLSEHQKKAHDKDKQVIKLRQQEQELETALQAKDMQIAGSRAQYEQVEKTLKLREAALITYQERITSFQEKIDKLTQDKESLLDGNQRNSLQIQTKVDELDRIMADEKRQNQELQQQAKERETELQAGIAEYTKALAIAQRGLDEKTLELQRSTITLKEAQSESKKLRQELVEYKLRASQVLQSKEKTIQELTERLTSGSEGGANMTANLGELLRTQQELLRAQQERDEYSHTVDQLRGNLQDVQTQAEADAEVFHSQLASCEELLEKEKKRVQALQIDLLTRSNESASAHSEAERALVEAKETLKTRDAEVAKLKKQISAKSQSSSGQMELENRLRSTTDHLLQKQAQIDTLLSEKSFLQLQLENTLQRERQPYANKNDHILSIKTSGPTDDEDHETEPRIRQRPIASLVPSNPYNPNFVSRKVVGAANFLDKMSASAGRVMRIYPLARLGVIAYIAMIHLLGFFLLASWNPEMHIDGLEDAPPPG